MNGYKKIKDTFVDFKSKYRSEASSIKSEILYVNKFKQVFASRKLVDDAVKFRNAVQHDKDRNTYLSLSDMEAKGYFDEKGNLKAEFKGLVDSRCREFCSEKFVGLSLSDKDAIILDSVNFYVSREIGALNLKEMEILADKSRVLPPASTERNKIGERIASLSKPVDMDMSKIDVQSLLNKFSEISSSAISENSPKL